MRPISYCECYVFGAYVGGRVVAATAAVVVVGVARTHTHTHVQPYMFVTQAYTRTYTIRA